MSIIKIV